MKKSLDVVTQRLFGTAAVILSFAALLYSIAPLKASQPTMTNNIGKYMISESGFALNGKPIYHVIVWDTETGKSKLYTYDSSGQLVRPDYQLPSSPLY